MASNPSTQQSLGEQHCQMRRLLERIQTSMQEQQMKLDTLARSLCELRDYLEMHFRHEEEDGFFNEIETMSPTFVSHVNELKSEHPQLLQLVDRMLSMIDSHNNQAWWASFGVQFEEFLTQFMAHEQRENTLYHKAFDAKSK